MDALNEEYKRRGRPRIKPDEWDKNLVAQIQALENEEIKKRLLALNLFRLEAKHAKPYTPIKKRWSKKYAKIQADYEALVESKNAATKSRELSFEIIILMGIALTQRLTHEELESMIKSLYLFPL